MRFGGSSDSQHESIVKPIMTGSLGNTPTALSNLVKLNSFATDSVNNQVYEGSMPEGKYEQGSLIEEEMTFEELSSKLGGLAHGSGPLYFEDQEE